MKTLIALTLLFGLNTAVIAGSCGGCKGEKSEKKACEKCTEEKTCEKCTEKAGKKC
jgi:hypothetical protein